LTTFVFVHGGYHGGWCFERIAAEVEARGHRAIAPDLPCDDPNAGYDEYVDAVLAAMGSREGADVVLVGHSLGCYTVPLVALRRPVGRMVLLCAVPALPGEPIPMDDAAIVSEDLVAAKAYEDGSGLHMMSPATFNHLFYEDCDPATAWAALVRLRPQGVRPLTEPWPLREWPDVPKTVVLATEDRVVNLDRGVAAARRLLDGGEPVVLPGSHSIFLTQVAALADVLTEPGGTVRPR
jgi:pimeloyl-ACP methyl ester carboxylesterase